MENQTLRFAKVVWFNPNQRFGVAGLLENGATVAIHLDRGRIFYRGGNHAELRAGGRRLENIPKPGDDVCLVLSTRPTRKGGRCAELWGMSSDWDEAGHDIHQRHHRLKLFEQNRTHFEAEAKRKREDDRLRCNPKFRLIEQEHRFGKPTSKPSMTLFEGTRNEFEMRQTSRRQQPLLTTNGKIIDGYQYVRWFERETRGGWSRCDNLMTIELPALPPATWGFEEACFALKGARIVRAPWRMTGVGFLWRNDDRILARGNCVEVFVEGDDLHEGTWLRDAEAEYIWEQGDKTDIGVTHNPSRYSVKTGDTDDDGIGTDNDLLFAPTKEKQP